MSEISHMSHIVSWDRRPCRRLLSVWPGLQPPFISNSPALVTGVPFQRAHLIEVSEGKMLAKNMLSILTGCQKNTKKMPTLGESSAVELKISHAFVRLYQFIPYLTGMRPRCSRRTAGMDFKEGTWNYAQRSISMGHRLLLIIVLLSVMKALHS